MLRYHIMKCKDIINVLEEQWPSSYALDWDNVGLLVGDKEQEVNHIFVALDLTDEVIEEAITAKADLIITHHPLIFSGLKQVTTENLTARRVMRLIANGISCYAMHTNFDVISMAKLNEDAIKISDTTVLSITKVIDTNQVYGIGRVGQIHQTMNLIQYASFVKEALKVPQVLYYGEENTILERVAISGGSGKSVIKDARSKGADVLITGDVDYHSAMDAIAEGLTIIDAGHYGTEYIFMNYVTCTLKDLLEGVSVKAANIHHPCKSV